MPKRFLQKKVRRNYLPILGIPVVLSLIGLFFVFEASSVRALSEVGNSFHYVRLQAIWIALGVAVFLFFSLFDYRRLYFLSFFAMVATVILLFLVLIPGIGH